MHCILGTEEDNPLGPKMHMVVEWAANLLDHRMPTREAMADDHLDLMMLMDPGDQ